MWGLDKVDIIFLSVLAVVVGIVFICLIGHYWRAGCDSCGKRMANGSRILIDSPGGGQKVCMKCYRIKKDADEWSRDD